MKITNTQKCTITLPVSGRMAGPILRPGTNEVDADYWAAVASHATVKMYLDAGHLALWTPPAETPAETTVQ